MYWCNWIETRCSTTVNRSFQCLCCFGIILCICIWKQSTHYEHLKITVCFVFEMRIRFRVSHVMSTLWKSSHPRFYWCEAHNPLRCQQLQWSLCIRCENFNEQPIFSRISVDLSALFFFGFSVIWGFHPGFKLGTKHTVLFAYTESLHSLG